jgi:glycerol uptake facilitator protein
MPSLLRRSLAEALGTFGLVFIGTGSVISKYFPDANYGVLGVAVAHALVLSVMITATMTISGGHLNPAVTLGFAVEGRTEWGDVPEYLAGEFVGAFIGATLVYLSYLNHWRETEDPGLKLAVFCTAPAIRNTVANIITEVVGTFVLVFGVMAFFADKTTSAAGLGGLLVGLLVLGIGLSLGGPTGYAINPARDLGPRIMHAILPIPGKGPSDWGYSWIPVVGPLIGGVIAALAFKAFFPG